MKLGHFGKVIQQKCLCEIKEKNMIHMIQIISKKCLLYNIRISNY